MKKLKLVTKFFFILIIYLFSFINVFSQGDEDSVRYTTETIEVDALRGYERLTPITFEDISRDKIEKKYFMQDLPMFLNGNTSVNAYSESGSMTGYSYFSIRGFDQRRIAVLINGTPQNDAEDHQVYWVDLSDITSSLESIQIQRGIGTALYGSSSIGGVVNLQTINYFNRKFLNVNYGYGSFNSRKYSLEYSSGLTNTGFGFYGKFTKMKTDGYRDLSWSDHWSYFLSAGKILGPNSVIKLNVYGSPIKNHLAYLGVTREYLDGIVTGDKLKDRKYNFLNFDNETDNYHQPHFELVYNIQAHKNLFISNTLSYFRGEGYFITNFPLYYGYDFSYFRLTPFYVMDSTAFNSGYYRRNADGTLYFEPGKGYQIDKSDIVANLHVNNNDFSWYPKIQWKHLKEKGILIVGGEVRFHTSEHFGEITFGNALPPGTPPNYQYYFYNGKKWTFSVYANELYKFTNKLTAMLGFQYANHKYSIDKDRFKPYIFDVNYSFLTPRIGMNYNFNKYLSGYVNFSMAKREPRLKDIYDAEGVYTVPNFRYIDTIRNIYSEPLVKPEELLNYEAGVGFTSDMFKANLNFYWMDFKNEIVNNGQLDNVGQPISGNAGKSVHRGIEFDFEFNPFVKIIKKNRYLSPIKLSGNLNLSENFFKEYREVLGVDNNGNIIYGNDYSNNKILLTPQIIGNLSLSYYSNFGIGAYFSLQHIGKQYLDNSEDEKKNPNMRNNTRYINKVINAYTVVNAGVLIDLVQLVNDKWLNKYFKTIEASFKVNNLFNTLYEMTGSVDGSGTPYWIPAATRNFYFNLRIGF